MRTETGQTIHLKDYAPPDWLVETVDLNFSLHPGATNVRAVLLLKPNPKTASAPLVLDGDGLRLKSLKIDGAVPAADSYIASPDRLTILQPPQRPFRIEIETEVDPTANTQLSGLYRSSGTYCTQCEAEGFRRITYFPDRPDVMAVYTTRIEADKAEALVLLANGNLAESGDLPNGRHYAIWKDPFPKPSYLFALVGGKLGSIEDRFVTMSGRDVLLRIYVEPGKENRCGYAMDSLKRSMRWDEQAFGREYDLDIFMIVAVSDFNMGAMENKGLNVFNDKYVLASSDTATDADFAGIESVIAHEYFHNWTGDRITCRDWFQLCLKEGLTVFRDQEFSADQRSHAVERVGDVRNLRNAQFVEDAGPLAHPVRPESYKEINNFYTSTVYEKGAEVVRMIKTMLGERAFRAGMDLYFQRHDGEAATVEQFVQCFADAGDRDMTQFMRWYSQAGTARVTVKTNYDSQAGTLTLDCKQMLAPTPGQPVKQPMVIPLRLGLVGDDGRDQPLQIIDGSSTGEGVLLLSQSAETFVFKGLSSRPRLSINRGFSAPIKLITDLSPDDLAFLAAHDSDPFNRWQAIQSIAMALLIENVALRAGKPARSGDKLITALATLFDDTALEPAFVALALSPPGEADIAREIGKDLDPEAIAGVRRRLRTAIGEALESRLVKTYDSMATQGPYSPDAANAGKRSLRNICLDLLAAGSKADALDRVMRQYETADNMTDRMAALSTLALHKGERRETALADFYKRYADNALVIDKWLALQAMIPETDTLDRVRGLMKHKAFDFSNPNRTRSLIGSFAQANPSQFNRPDGQGYEFVADIILALDPKNPQVAARLATAYRTWRSMEDNRRGKAESALMRIRGATNLSRDASEIVERTLAAE